MICFEIYLNGERLCRAGRADISVLSSNIWFVAQSDDREEELAFEVGGMYKDETRGTVHPRWVQDKDLKIGDEITIRLVESDTADHPASETIDDPDFVLEQQKKYYEILKTQFEPNDPQ